MNQSNPYEAPKANLETRNIAPGELAGRDQRLAAAIVDSIIGFLLAVPIWLTFDIWGNIQRGTALPFSTTIISMIFGFALFIVAHGYFLAKSGQTIGKKLVGIQITDLNNELVDFVKLVGLRYAPISACTIIPIIGTLLPLIDSLFIFRSDRRCVHDLIAGTKVIRMAKA